MFSLYLYIYIKIYIYIYFIYVSFILIYMYALYFNCFKRVYLTDWLSAPKQKLQFSQNKFIWYNTMLPLQHLLFYWPFFYNKNILYLIKMSKIADLTYKIMRKFLFLTCSSFYVRLSHAIYVTLPLFEEMGQINYFTVHFCLLHLLLEFGILLLLLHSFLV